MSRKSINQRYSQLRDALLGRLRLRLGVNAQESEDLTQEAFLQVLKCFRGKCPLDEMKHPCAYLYKVAWRVQAAVARHNGCVVYDSGLASAVPEADLDRSMPSLEEALSLERQFEEAIRKLPREQLTVLLLCKHQGMTHEEAARASGISAHMVEKHLIRAYAALALEEWDL